jgi:hypothetical protein
MPAKMPELQRSASAGSSGFLPKISGSFHLLGLDHEVLNYNYADRDLRLTNVGQGGDKILA